MQGNLGDINRIWEEEMLLLFNISAEFAYSQDRRPLTDRARSVVFSSLPDAILVSGQITGEAASMHDLMSVKKHYRILLF